MNFQHAEQIRSDPPLSRSPGKTWLLLQNVLGLFQPFLSSSFQDTLRSALAMGADRALHVTCQSELQPLAVAKLLAAVVKREHPGLCLLGKQATDDDSNQTVSRPVGSWVVAISFQLVSEFVFQSGVIVVN